MTAPREYVKMARSWLYDNDLPAEWEDAVAQEFDAAIADRKIEIVSTHEQGRPYDTPLVEWEHRELQPEHQDCIPWDDAQAVRR